MHELHLTRPAGSTGDWLFWPARHPFLWGLWLQHHALYELCFRELWEEGWQLHILWPPEIQLLPPLLLLWTYHDFRQVPCPGKFWCVYKIEEVYSVSVCLNNFTKQWRPVNKTEGFDTSGEQHQADPQGEGDVEYHHQGLVAPGSNSGGGRLLPLSLHLDHPQWHEVGHQAFWLVFRWVTFME